MSNSYSRDRTAELRGSSSQDARWDSDGFGPRRTPTGYHAQRSQSPGGPRVNPFAQNTAPSRTFSPSAQPQSDSFVSGGGAEYYSAGHEVEAYPLRQRPPAQLNTMDGFFEEVDGLKADISTVTDNVEQIERLHTSALVSFNEQQSRQIAKDLERLKQETQKQNNNIRDRVKALEASNTRYPDDSDGQIRRSQSEAIRKRFMETIQKYQDVERIYKQKYRQRVERQIRIVKPDASPEEVDNLIDSDESPQVFAQSLMNAGRKGQANAVLSEVQNRHDDIRKIERTILELHQLFQDMQMLVEQQGTVLTQAEQNAETTVGHLEQGNTMIGKAIRSARATRHKKWCCLVLVIILCVVIAILVWWFGFGHPGTGGNNNSNNSQ